MMRIKERTPTSVKGRKDLRSVSSKTKRVPRCVRKMRKIRIMRIIDKASRPSSEA